MKIDYCLILAAGFGTRMGEIGKILPKVLWPVFEKSLLELEIEYARSLGIKKIFINLHHQADIIQKFLNQIDHHDITVLFEPEILDVGGAVHNLANHKSVNYNGNLLILNSDQFLFFDKKYFLDGLKLIQSHASCLFMIQVDKAGKYNKVDIKEDTSGSYFKNIIPASEVKEDKFWTYSGNSLVNLGKISPIQGKTNFYQTVAIYDRESVPVLKLTKLSYWDFGTLSRYVDSLIKIINCVKNNEADEFINFLVRVNALHLTKLDQVCQSYNSSRANVLDFSTYCGPKINLGESVEYQNLKVTL